MDDTSHQGHMAMPAPSHNDNATDEHAHIKHAEHAALFGEDGTMETLYSLSGHALEHAAGPGAQVVTAVQSGDWSDPATWGGVPPSTNALVLIPEGVSVSYDVIADTPLFSVFVKGGLHFATDQTTKMVVDTLVEADTGHLSIGTEETPLAAGHRADILIRADGAPADQRDWDPGQFTKGIVTHGVVDIFGAEKTSKIALAADANAGDTELLLSGMPVGWSVGDQLVLQGTSYDADGSDADNTRFHDEELTITGLTQNADGTVSVSFTNNHASAGTALRFDHTRPDGESFDSSELTLYAANLTRNITVQSNAGEASMPANGGDVHTRGHVMFMHNEDVQVHDAAFVDLGRTDKLQLLDNDGGTNVVGRYSLHFHRTGADDIASTPAEAEGVVVKGSPGWGLVHHQSHLNITDSVVYEVQGAGIAAEAGDEIGIWTDNFVLKVMGDGQSLSLDGPNVHGVPLWAGTGDPTRVNPTDEIVDRVGAFDFGFAGEAYWMQGGGQVQMLDNTAASSVTGLTHFAENANLVNKDASTIAVGNLRLREPDGSLTETEIYLELKSQGYADDDRVPVGALPPKQIDGFEASNVATGAVLWDVQRDEDGRPGFDDTAQPGEGADHDVSGVVSDLTVWGTVKQGVVVRGSSQLTFEDALIVGDPDAPVHYEAGGARGGSGLAVNLITDDTAVSFPGLRQEGFGGTDDGLGPLTAREEALEALSEFDEAQAPDRVHEWDFRANSEQLSSDDAGIYSISRGIIRGTDGGDTLDARGMLLRDVDLVSGGDGDDTLYGQVTRHNDLKGDDGNDFVAGGQEADILSGGKGNDRVFGGGGNDYISGGSGADFLSGGTGNDFFQVHFGNEWYSVIDGGSGFDALVSSLYWDGMSQFNARASSIEWIGHHGRRGLETHPIHGDDQANVLDFRGALSPGGYQYVFGFDGDDAIFGLGYKDVLVGGEGDDMLSGQRGGDELVGDAGNDILYGGLGDDNLNGGAGTDVLNGGFGNDQISAGAGDIVEYGLGHGDDVVTGGDPFVLRIEAAALPSGGLQSVQTPDGIRVNLVDGSILFEKRSNLDNITIDVVGDVTDGPQEYATPTADETPFYFLREDTGEYGRLSFGSSYSTGVSAGTQYGTDGHDKFKEAWELVKAGDGNDALQAAPGAFVYGEAGHDNFSADVGVMKVDYIDGGTGIDRLSTDRETRFESFSRADTNIEILTGDLIGTNDDNVFDLRGVNAVLYSRGGETFDVDNMPKLRGEGGNDTIYGNRNGNEIHGGDGNDILHGLGGDDVIDAGAGDDVVRGGAGRDTIRLGGGRDTVEVGPGSGTTIVEDFRLGEDTLRIDTAAAFGPADLTVREIAARGIGQGTYIELADGSEIYLAKVVGFDPAQIEFAPLSARADAGYDLDPDEEFIFNLMASRNDLDGKPEFGFDPGAVDAGPGDGADGEGDGGTDGGDPPPVNTAPSIVGGPLTQAVDEGASHIIDLASLFQDADGDALSYEILSGPGFTSLGTTDTTGSELHVTPADGDDGDHVITVRAFDGQAYSNALTINVTVADAITPPDPGGDGETPRTAGLKASFFDLGYAVSRLSDIDFDADPTVTDVVDGLNYVDGRATFWEGGAHSNFAAKYEGDITIPVSGRYTFHLSSDDGSMLFIDGQMVLGNDGLHATRTESVTLDLDAGGHEIEVHYFEHRGSQTLKLEWESGDAGLARQVITGDALSHADASGAEAPPADEPADPPPPPVGDSGEEPSGAGLQASYFDLGYSVSQLSDIDFDAAPTASAVVDGLDHMDSRALFWEGGAHNNFAALYEGDLNVETAGAYTFHLSSDDGSMLFIDGAVAIGNDRLHATRTESVTLDLSAGAHAIEVRYFEARGGQTLRLEWESADAGIERQVISGDSLSHGTPASPAYADGGAAEDGPAYEEPADEGTEYGPDSGADYGADYGQPDEAFGAPLEDPDVIQAYFVPDPVNDLDTLIA